MEEMITLKKGYKIGQIVFIQTTTPPSTFKTAPVI